MSVSATEWAIMRLTLTQMLRRRMLYSTRVAAPQMGCTLLPVASPYLTKFLKKAIVRGLDAPPRLRVLFSLTLNNSESRRRRLLLRNPAYRVPVGYLGLPP